MRSLNTRTQRYEDTRPCKFIEKGLDERRQVLGDIQPAGIRPKFMPRLEAAGFHLPPEVFGVRQYGRRMR